MRSVVPHMEVHNGRDNGYGVHTLACHDPTRRGQAWPFLHTLARDPRVPEALKDPHNWRKGYEKYGEDEGVSAHREHRRRLVDAFRKLRAEIEAFNPDFILMFGDDQYENFTEDIIPPFVSWRMMTSPVTHSKGVAAGMRTSGVSLPITPSRCRAGRR